AAARVQRRALRVRVDNMNALDPDVAHQARPAGAVTRPGLDEIEAEGVGDVQEGLLDEPRYHAGVGTAAGRRSGTAGVARLLLAHRVAQGVVRARFSGDGGIEVETRPRLDHRVDIGDAEL